ncbi:MAG: hypothetical protein K2P73_15080 [Lachnospiraceae bacterium]|nr:hypothetical protein [Lachnospiraceae bacterium]
MRKKVCIVVMGILIFLCGGCSGKEEENVNPEILSVSFLPGKGSSDGSQ